MAQKLYGSTGGLSNEVAKIYGSVGGLSKNIVKGYCSESGLSKLFFEEYYEPLNVFENGVFIDAKPDTSMSNVVKDNTGVPDSGTWGNIARNVSQYLGTNTILMLGQTHMNEWTLSNNNLYIPTNNLGHSTSLLLIPINRTYSKKISVILKKGYGSYSRIGFGYIDNNDSSVLNIGVSFLPSTAITSWTEYSFTYSPRYWDYVLIGTVSQSMEVKSIHVNM